MDGVQARGQHAVVGAEHVLLRVRLQEVVHAVRSLAGTRARARRVRAPKGAVYISWRSVVSGVVGDGARPAPSLNSSCTVASSM